MEIKEKIRNRYEKISLITRIDIEDGIKFFLKALVWLGGTILLFFIGFHVGLTYYLYFWLAGFFWFIAVPVWALQD